jgi:hypothetical protein
MKNWRIWLTGDLHGRAPQHLDSLRNRAKSIGMSKETDILVQLGDFGHVWTEIDQVGMEWLENCPWLTLFLDGNHDNHEILQSLPRKELFGGQVGYFENYPSIFHLRRGEIYEINGQKFFVFGSAKSIDRARRVEGINWWPGEFPTVAEQEYALKNLEKHGNEVDVMLTHTVPTIIVHEMCDKYNNNKLSDPAAMFLEHLMQIVTYKEWYAGHMHEDCVSVRDERIRLMWKDIILHE